MSRRFSAGRIFATRTRRKGMLIFLSAIFPINSQRWVSASWAGNSEKSGGLKAFSRTGSPGALYSFSRNLNQRRIQMEQAHSFTHRLNETISRHAILNHPFYQAWNMG